MAPELTLMSAKFTACSNLSPSMLLRVPVRAASLTTLW
jgi:hypothetical protein